MPVDIKKVSDQRKDIFIDHASDEGPELPSLSNFVEGADFVWCAEAWSKCRGVSRTLRRTSLELF